MEFSEKEKQLLKKKIIDTYKVRLQVLEATKKILSNYEYIPGMDMFIDIFFEEISFVEKIFDDLQNGGIVEGWGLDVERVIKEQARRPTDCVWIDGWGLTPDRMETEIRQELEKMEAKCT